MVWSVCLSLLALHVPWGALEVDAGFQGDVGGQWCRGSGGGDGGGGGGGSARRAQKVGRRIRYQIELLKRALVCILVIIYELVCMYA